MIVFIQGLLGLVFGLGLVVSGMSNPAKVLNFLDVGAIPAGGWDPSLLLVMGGAVTVGLVGFTWVLKRPGPLLGDRFHLPDKLGVDQRLLVGAGLFGAGWGLSGFCPGPALTGVGFAMGGLTSDSGSILMFFVAMCVGMAVARALSHRTPR